ncbi:hypothetical protein SDC9_131048 [bioreactor metagenome]|uniref:Uncharacterized protein n=1 Tax=bioreactor metagenome TaxID=1076179 RepID=A0A645D4I3_9ZZZZ
MEQRLRGARQRAAVEGHAERAGAIIGSPGEFGDLVDGVAALGGGAGNLEDDHIAGHAAAFAGVIARSGGHVVGDLDGAHVVALGAQTFGGLAEMQHIAGVVAIGDDDAATVVGGLRDGVGLGGRR